MTTATVETIERMASRIARTQHDPEQAAADLLDQVYAENIADPVLADLCRRAAVAAINRARTTVRQGFKARVTSRNADNASAYSVAVGILHQWTVGCTRLGLATREDLMEAAQCEREKARGHVETAKFYELLAGRMKKGQRVENVVDEKSASELLRRAQQEAA